MFLVVIVDLGHRHDAWVLLAGVRRAPGGLLVPVEDAADERRDERHFGLGARDRLPATNVRKISDIFLNI